MPTYAYVFTVNNYTSQDEAAYQACIGTRGITYVIYGREIAPTTGTPHLQGYLQCNHKNTKRLNDALPCKKHIMAKGSWQKNYDYVTKGGDWIAFGDPDQEHPGQGQGRRSDLAGVKEAIERGETYEEICETHFEAAAKYNRFIKEQVTARATSTELNSLRAEFERASLRGWQRELVEIVDADPHPRKIHWIWESNGNTGKSWMTKYLAAMKNACIMAIGKKTDMAYLYSKNPSNVVVFDLSRTTAPGEGKEHFLDGAYSLAEDLKNGMVTSYKYDSSLILKKHCHVIFFANYPPDLSKWSSDRYSIKEL